MQHFKIVISKIFHLATLFTKGDCHGEVKPQNPIHLHSEIGTCKSVDKGDKASSETSSRSQSTTLSIKYGYQCIGKQPIRTLYLGHVTGYQPIRDQFFPDLVGTCKSVDKGDKASSETSSRSQSTTLSIKYGYQCIGDRPKQVNSQSELFI
eukprot:sb/3473454/